MTRRSVFVAMTLGALLVVAGSAAAKGIMKVSLDRPMIVAGKSIGPGTCMITWVSHSPETDVSFAVHGKVVVEAHGKMIERPEKAEKDMVVTATDETGKDVLKEIRFGGKKSVLVME